MLLNPPQNATPEQVKQKYRDYVKQWHPDKFQDETGKRISHEKMQKGNEAYEVLSDTVKRSLYDRSLSMQTDNETNNLLSQANNLFFKKKFKQAIILYEQILDREPFDINSIYCKILCLIYDKKYYESLSFCRKVIDMKIDDSLVWTMNGVSYHQLENYY